MRAPILSHSRADADAPVHDSTVGSILMAAAAECPGETAVIAWGLGADERRTWTYDEFKREAIRTAGALLARFRPGEHVAVYAPNLPEWLLLEFGAGLAGLVLVTVNPAYRARELDYVLRQSRAAGIFYVAHCRGNALAEHVAEVRPNLPSLREAVAIEDWAGFLAAAPAMSVLPEVSPGDTAQIQYTSGTTGAPKGARLHHRGLTNNARAFSELLGLAAGGVYAHSMPFFHTAGCGLGALGAIAARAAHAFLPGFEAARMLALIEAERGTVMLGVPTMLIAMLEHPDSARRDLSSLKVVSSGGSSVPPELVRAFSARFGVSFSVVYGQTECSPLITMVRPGDAPEDAINTIGQPMPNTEMKIVDPATGAVVPCGVVGELCTRGYHLMQEYFELSEATAATIDGDGWLHTGDLGSMDERGFCRITGRLKDMVIRGGENVFPAEIEAVLHEHEQVLDAAVLGVPDPLMGEELAAFVRLGASRPSARELHAHVRSHLAAHKTPRYWVFVDAYPLTGSGKIQKFALRQQWQDGEFQATDLKRELRGA